MEVIIDSEGSEIKLLSGYLKGTVCIAYRSCSTGVFFYYYLERIFSHIFGPAKAKVIAP